MVHFVRHGRTHARYRVLVQRKMEFQAVGVKEWNDLLSGTIAASCREGLSLWCQSRCRQPMLRGVTGQSVVGQAAEATRPGGRPSGPRLLPGLPGGFARDLMRYASARWPETPARPGRATASPTSESGSAEPPVHRPN